MRARVIIVATVAILFLIVGLFFLGLRGQSSDAAQQPAPSLPPTAQKTQARAAQPEPVDLGSVLDLRSLTDCSRGPRLAAIFEQMVTIDAKTFESRRGGPISVPGYDRPLVPTFERTRETGDQRDIRAVSADLDLAGHWHGLAVSGLRRSFYEESDASAFDIRFAEPPERVRETLIRHGFRLPSVGEMREVGDEPGISVEIGVAPIEGGAALTCATG